MKRRVSAVGCARDRSTWRARSSIECRSIHGRILIRASTPNRGRVLLGAWTLNRCVRRSAAGLAAAAQTQSPVATRSLPCAGCLHLDEPRWCRPFPGPAHICGGQARSPVPRVRPLSLKPACARLFHVKHSVSVRGRAPSRGIEPLTGRGWNTCLQRGQLVGVWPGHARWRKTEWRRHSDRPYRGSARQDRCSWPAASGATDGDNSLVAPQDHGRDAPTSAVATGKPWTQFPLGATVLCASIAVRS